MTGAKNFKLEEFIPEEVYSIYGEKSLRYIDERIVNVAQFFRERYGFPITINDWYKGGVRNLSGLRPWDTTVGASTSQHKFGRAIDMKWLGGQITPEQIREDIKENEIDFLTAGITTIEEGTSSWIHADCRFTGRNEILFIPFY